MVMIPVRLSLSRPLKLPGFVRDGFKTRLYGGGDINPYFGLVNIVFLGAGQSAPAMLVIETTVMNLARLVDNIFLDRKVKISL